MQILDILDRYNAKATFFVIYHQKVDNNYKEIVNRGHTIALHSYTHDYSVIYKSPDAFFNDLNKISSHVEKLTGQKPKYIRFPGGSGNTISRKYCSGVMTTLTQEVENRGYRYFDWDISSGDADVATASKDYILNKIKTSVYSKQSIVILMHDTAKKTTTVDALPEVMEFLKSKGYEFCAIDDNTPQVHAPVRN